MRIAQGVQFMPLGEYVTKKSSDSVDVPSLAVAAPELEAIIPALAKALSTSEVINSMVSNLWTTTSLPRPWRNAGRLGTLVFRNVIDIVFYRCELV